MNDEQEGWGLWLPAAGLLLAPALAGRAAEQRDLGGAL
jgi:hypothetical protein